MQLPHSNKYLVLRLQQQDVGRVHAEELQQVEHRHDEVEERVAEAADEVVQARVHGHGRERVGVALWDAPMQHLLSCKCPSLICMPQPANCQ